MATGGAKDAANFRDNIQEGYVPHPDSLAYEGLFYDYYFDTGDTTGGDSLFYPSYSMAVTESPLTGDVERYLTVGLNSNLTEDDLERKPLNLVAVVDVSGSMGSQFDQYYYDEHGNRREVTTDDDDQSKMAAAREALSALTEQLRDEDRFGVVLYSNDAHVAKPLRRVGETNMDAIRDHITDISAGGGTDMSAGYSAAMDLLEPHHGANLAEVENRVVFMTDAMPNLGTTDRDDIVDEFDAAAEKHVHTTFVGIGLDTNADLVESISGVRGANHYFVHSTEEFTQRLADEFTYMVTPLVFDLSLDVVSDGYEIKAVYGSPNADRATGEVMHVTTLFPSPTSEGEKRGGVTLLQLKETDPDASLELVANWVERDGTQDRDTATLSFPTTQPEHFDNTGIRKAVLLSRYGRLLREWMAAVRDDTGDPDGETVDDWISPDERELGEWEAQSVPLTVPTSYRDEFETLRKHVTSELEAIEDDELIQEIEILKLLSDSDAIAETRTAETTETASHPDNCPNCGEDITGYGPDPHLCPHCGVKVS
jgi:Ca-activated chloride channel family protein